MTDLTAVSSGELLVGISVSEPSEGELISLGMSELHIRHAFIETVRHVLAAGWSVAYGGDFRHLGYTEALLDLVRTYERTVLSGPDHVFCYLAWPIGQELKDSDRADLANVATVVALEAPEGSPATLSPVAERTVDERLWNLRSLTAMRRRMASELGALVVVGGRLSGQQGLVPGVVEEAAAAIDAHVPLFVAGGFGGAGRAVAQALDGGSPAELSVEYQQANTNNYGELFEAAKRTDLNPGFSNLLDTLNSIGYSGLNNRLNDDENHLLAITDDFDTLVALVLRGLFRLAGDLPS
jgi:hypothetical protein